MQNVHAAAAAHLVKLALFTLLIQGCAFNSTPTGPTIVEVVSTMDEVRGALNVTPTNFVMPYKTDKRAFERLNFFLRTYIKGAPIYKNDLIEAKTESDFIYLIKRQKMASGFEYNIECKPPTFGSKEEALTNAQNLARFITTGELELSLMK